MLYSYDKFFISAVHYHEVCNASKSGPELEENYCQAVSLRCRCGACLQHMRELAAAFTLHKWERERQYYFQMIFSQHLLNSHVYTLQHSGLASYTIVASHKFTWLSSIRIAVFTTLVSWKCFHHSCALSRAMIWLTLTATETWWRNSLAVFHLGYSLAKSVTELY